MAIEDLLKTIQQSQMLGKQSGLHSQLAELAKSQEVWKKRLIGSNMLGDIAKTLKIQEAYNKSHLFNMGDIAKNWAAISKPILPDSTLSAIRSIGLQHQQIFSQFKAASEALQKIAIPNHFPSLQIALRGITSQMASVSAATRRWDLIEDFEEISNEAVSIGESITDKGTITGNDIEIIKDFLGRIETKIDTKDTDWFSLLLKWMAVIGFVLALIAEARNWVDKPEAASKQDIKQLKKDVYEKLESKLKERNDSSFTNRACWVRYKPLSQSKPFTLLSEDCNVVILSVRHKWAYISYINPKDSLAETGWVLKKYLYSIVKGRRQDESLFQ
jgi:hypothetical protein